MSQRPSRARGAAATLLPLLLAACADVPTLPASAPSSSPTAWPGPADFRPFPRSTLAPGKEAAFVIARRQQGAQTTLLLARQGAEGTAPRPVARIVQRAEGSAARVAVQRLAAAALPDAAADQELALLGHLYTLALRQEPLARYCLSNGPQPCDAAHADLSHAQLLQALADARSGVAAQAASATPWRVVGMAQAPTRSWDADVVAVTALGPQGPMEGVSVYFNRAPHSLCVARSGADGVARCRLVDQHGDEHQHDHSTPVVATFPGDVRPQQVLLPTTFVLPAPAPADRPAFAAPPFALPARP